jgi:ABC-type glycerol-3-phosphate transport system substrate-binding protein
VRIRKSKSVRLAAILAASSIVLAACGDDDDDGGEAAPAATDATAATEAPAAATTAPAASETQGETIRLWLNGGDTPDPLVQYAIAEFNKIHPDVTVNFERRSGPA